MTKNGKENAQPLTEALPEFDVRLASSDDTAGMVTPESCEFVIPDSVAHVTVVTGRLFDRVLASRLREHGVPIGQFPFLLFLWADESLSQRDMSRMMAIEESTVTNTIDRMVRDGLVLRERASDDLRRNRLKLTRRGQQLRDLVIPEARAVMNIATAGMSSAEVFFLLSLLRKIQVNLKDADRPT